MHPSLLPRWRGAAPIERAIMAGDERTGVCVMRLTEGLDSGPVALREEVAIGPEEDFEALSARLAALGGELLVRALDLLAEGRLEFAEQDEDGVTYAEKIEPGRAPARPCPPGRRAGRGGPRPDPARRRLPGDRRRRAPRRAPRPRGRRRGRRPGRSRVEDGALLLGCGEGALRLEVVQPPGGKPMPADAYLRGHSLPAHERGRAAEHRPGARARLRGDPRDLRAGRLHRARLPRAGAERLGLDGRERAQAQRLAYGAVQRRGTTDAAIERLADRSSALLDPPVLAGLRLGLYELLFADGTPDHAAVDQAVELVKGAGAAHASGLVNAVLRRAAREREQLTAALLGDDSTPERAAVAHSAPLWLARMWWEELGAEVAPLAACGLQRAGGGRRCAPTATARRRSAR